MTYVCMSVCFGTRKKLNFLINCYYKNIYFKAALCWAFDHLFDKSFKHIHIQYTYKQCTYVSVEVIKISFKLFVGLYLMFFFFGSYINFLYKSIYRSTHSFIWPHRIYSVDNFNFNLMNTNYVVFILFNVSIYVLLLWLKD